MTESKPSSRLLDHDLCVHIFTASAGMVGVCLTVIGIIRVVISLRKADLFVDDLLAGDAILYLIACLLSYWALRTRNAGWASPALPALWAKAASAWRSRTTPRLCMALASCGASASTCR